MTENKTGPHAIPTQDALADTAATIFESAKRIEVAVAHLRDADPANDSAAVRTITTSGLSIAKDIAVLVGIAVVAWHSFVSPLSG